MTMLMDIDKENSTRECVSAPFQQNAELENKRRKAAQDRVPSDPNTWQNMRENYEAVILEDHAFSEQHDVEYALPCHWAKYGLPLGYFSDDPDSQIPVSKDGNKSSDVTKGFISCHRCLIYLGDLARYKSFYGDSKAWDFTAASSYYMQASSIWPSSGNPHHQLAILAGYSNDELLSVYRYFRSLALDNPFINARDNLIIPFEKEFGEDETWITEGNKSTTTDDISTRN
ncbi:hypothetical protein CASFOL_032045 [Castilleja foliolosa]|uniref:Uncharacterized protein n=1 Tax=Castilleja foliolosa TaxID=1961234 RepID=A0ABD3C1P6_9LAMI